MWNEKICVKIIDRKKLFQVEKGLVFFVKSGVKEEGSERDKTNPRYVFFLQLCNNVSMTPNVVFLAFLETKQEQKNGT